jgi:eukaryotic-like serine/threonine-protein kinase
MRFLNDKSLERLRAGGAVPDLSGTRYRLVEFLARGGMGAVYAADDQSLDRRVALKVLEAEDPQGTMAGRLLREARVLAQLEHPGIVPVHDAGTLADGRVFYVMKFVEGARLDQFLAGLPSLSDRLRLFLRICDAVSFAHSRGILHRDLKPANVMVGAFGEILVMDWGLAKILARCGKDGSNEDENDTLLTSLREPSNESVNTQASAITGDGMIMGTPGYMSPEQASGKTGSVEVRSDIFSLGKLLEFTANSAGQSPNVKPPRALRAIYEKAAAANPQDRYPSVPALNEDLSRFLDGRPVSAYQENILERAHRFYRRYQAAILLILTYLVMRVLFILYPRHSG